MDESNGNGDQPKPVKEPKKSRKQFSKVTIIKTKTGASPMLRKVPEVLAPVLMKSKITRKAMAKYLEAVLVAYAPHILPELMKSALEGTVNGDIAKMKMAAEIYGLTSSKTGPVVQVLQQVVNGSEDESADRGHSRSLDAVIREQAKRKQIEAGQIIDVSPA